MLASMILIAVLAAGCTSYVPAAGSPSPTYGSPVPAITLSTSIRLSNLEDRVNALERAVNGSVTHSINQTVFDLYRAEVNSCRSEIIDIRANDGSPGAALRCTTLDLRCDMLEIKLQELLDIDYNKSANT